MGRSTPKNNGANQYKHSMSFDAKGDKHSARDMKAYLKNREYLEHKNKIIFVSVTGVCLFVAILITSIIHMNQENKPVFFLLGSLSKSMTFGDNAYTDHNMKLRNVLFPPSSSSPSWLIICGKEGEKISPNFVQVAKQILLQHGNSDIHSNTTRMMFGVVNCNEQKYLPNMFLSKQKQQARLNNINVKDLLSIKDGLNLNQIENKDDTASMFMTSYRRKTRQLNVAEMKTVKLILSTLSKHNNYNLKLTSIKNNKKLYASCLDTMYTSNAMGEGNSGGGRNGNVRSSTSSGTAEACVVILKRGPLELEIKNTLKKIMLKFRYLNWIQIDLDEYALQPMPMHEEKRSGNRVNKKNKKKKNKKKRNVAHQWPRIAITRTSPTKIINKKKGRKKKKKGSSSTVPTKKKDVISWKWYPSSLLLTDSNAITSFIESADQSNWSILDDLPSQSSKKLRIVEL